jgi:hypothetical protein
MAIGGLYRAYTWDIKGQLRDSLELGEILELRENGELKEMNFGGLKWVI